MFSSTYGMRNDLLHSLRLVLKAPMILMDLAEGADDVALVVSHSLSCALNLHLV